MSDILTLFDSAIQWYNNYVGSYAILFMLIPTGLYFIFRLKFLNVTKIGHAIAIVRGKYDHKKDEGDLSHFKTLTTALAATVGTGNIVGVALAIYLGGPGAIFWLWVTGFLGMILKYSECTLSHKYRVFNTDGTVSGGPMYYIRKGITDIYHWPKFAKGLAIVFAIATILASFGTGNMAQSNGMAGALLNSYGINVYVSGLIITSLVLLIIIGGVTRIGEVSSKLVPFMAIVYISAGIIVLIDTADQIPHTLYLIVSDAFTGTAATGGFVGSTFMMTMLWGVRRGLFSNEAGQGSAPIAHAAARTEYPVREGLVASLEPLVDTLIICTMTGLIVINTGAWTTGEQGVGMTIYAMNAGLAKAGLVGIGKHIVTWSLMLFAFTTIIAWSYYGTRAANYLFGEKSIKYYYWIYGLFVFFGSIWGLDIVWHFVDMVITFMTIPNLIALLLLSGVVIKETNAYFNMMKKNGGKEKIK